MAQCTVRTTVHAPLERVWDAWTQPEHITQWNAASDDWCCPSASNDLQPGGRFTSRMEAVDKSVGFDFGGTYSDVQTHKLLRYSMDDDRHVEVTFESDGENTTVTETFDLENQNSAEMQQQGWQAILNRFKAYVESFA